MHPSSFGFAAQPLPASQLPAPTPGVFWSRLDGSREPYLLASPSGERRPRGLAIYLHGHGSGLEQGWILETYSGCFARLRLELDRRSLAYATLNYRGKTSWMNPAAASDLSQLIDLLRVQLAVERVFLIGGSMGGSSALAFAALHCEKLDGLIALCPAPDIGAFHAWSRTRGNPVSQELADAIEASYGGTPQAVPHLFEQRSSLRHPGTNLPLVVVHGDQDALIPVEPARQFTGMRQAMGLPIIYEELTGGDHDAPVHLADWPRYLDFLKAGFEVESGTGDSPYRTPDCMQR